MNNTEEIKNVTSEETVDPMVFLSPEEVAEENKKAEEFFKAFRFGASNFFSKIKEVYELEGIKGLLRLEMSLDTYMNIRQMVFNEIASSNPEVNDNTNEYPNEEFTGTEAGEEDTAMAD